VTDNLPGLAINYIGELYVDDDGIWYAVTPKQPSVHRHAYPFSGYEHTVYRIVLVDPGSSAKVSEMRSMLNSGGNTVKSMEPGNVLLDDVKIKVIFLDW
jgi:hypothetical protein